MNIANTTQTPATLSTQAPSSQTSTLKIANDQPKVALQLIPPAPQATGNIGNNINYTV